MFSKPNESVEKVKVDSPNPGEENPRNNKKQKLEESIENLQKLFTYNIDTNKFYQILNELDANLISEYINENWGYTLLTYIVNDQVMPLNTKNDIIKAIIAKGVNVNFPDKYKYTILIYAMKEGNVDIVRYLLENTVAKLECLEVVPFEDIVKHNHLKTLNYLMDKYPEIVSNFGSTILGYSISYGYLDIMKSLLKKGVNIHTTIHGKNLLEYTTLLFIKNDTERHLDIINYLLENSDLKNEAVRDFNGDIECKILVPKLTLAVQKAYFKVIEYFLNLGADITYRDSSDHTILYYALKSNNIELVKYLVEKNIDLTQSLYDSDAPGKVPSDNAIWYAFSKGQIEIVDVLLRNGGSLKQIIQYLRSHDLPIITEQLKLFEKNIEWIRHELIFKNKDNLKVLYQINECLNLFKTRAEGEELDVLKEIQKMQKNIHVFLKEKLCFPLFEVSNHIYNVSNKLILTKDIIKRIVSDVDINEHINLLGNFEEELDIYIY